MFKNKGGNAPWVGGEGSIFYAEEIKNGWIRLHRQEEEEGDVQNELVEEIWVGVGGLSFSFRETKNDELTRNEWEEEEEEDG